MKQFFVVSTLNRGVLDNPQPLDEENNRRVNLSLMNAAIEAECRRPPQWQIDEPFADRRSA